MFFFSIITRTVCLFFYRRIHHRPQKIERSSVSYSKRSSYEDISPTERKSTTAAAEAAAAPHISFALRLFLLLMVFSYVVIASWAGPWSGHFQKSPIRPERE